MNKITSAFVGALLFGVAPFVNAISLQNLFDGAEIQTGDKRFYDWGLLNESRVWRSMMVDTPQTLDVDYNQVDVFGSSVDPLNQVLSYSFAGGAGFSVSDPDDPQGSTEILEVVFSYKVETLDGSASIIEDTLSLIDFSGSLLYSLRVGETLGGAMGQVGAKEVFSFDDDFDPDELLVDTEQFAPQSFLYVATTVRMSAAGQGPSNGSAALSSFEQSYRQTAIPEPASLALLVFGIAGIGYRWRGKTNA